MSLGGLIRIADWFSCAVRVMNMRSAVLLILILSTLGQAQPRSEEDRIAELKRRVVETLRLRPGDTAADVGCGDGFYTIPLARFLGPSGKVFAEDISDAELIKLKEHITKEGLKNVEAIKGADDDPRLPPDRPDDAMIVHA